MRKLLIIKKMNMFNKSLEKQDKDFCISSEYKKFDNKEIEIILNDKKLILKMIHHLQIKDGWLMYNSYQYKRELLLSKVDLNNIVGSYIDYLFEFKKLTGIKININLFFNLLEIKNIIYLVKNKNIGMSLIRDIENIKLIKKLKQKSNVDNILAENFKANIEEIDSGLSIIFNHLRFIFKNKKENFDLIFELKRARIKEF
jgi:hypothetical protein